VDNDLALVFDISIADLIDPDVEDFAFIYGFGRNGLGMHGMRIVIRWDDCKLMRLLDLYFSEGIIIGSDL